MLREIVLDTETTGFEWKGDDRIIEIGCVELINRIPTGREFHAFINPQRDVPDNVVAVHGITTAFLVDKPLFSAVAGDFLEFIGEDPLVIHNAQFDVNFLNAELGRIGPRSITWPRVVDTLALAKRRHPAGPNSLDALCKRYGIDNSKRIKHGALMDSLLLAQVYIELLGERQATLGLGSAAGLAARNGTRTAVGLRAKPRPAPLPPRLTAEEHARHAAFVETLGANAVWKRYSGGCP